MKMWMRVVSVTLIVMLLMSGTVMAEEVEYGERLEELMDLIMDKYLYSDAVSEEALFEGAMNGMFDTLDSYSTYLPPSNAKTLSNNLNNTYVGIGVQLSSTGDYVVIDRVFFDGPADNGGLKVHDKIVEASGISLIGKTPTETAAIVMGEKGTEVTLKIDRNGYIFEVTLVRDQIRINAIDRLDPKDVYPAMPISSANKIGYLKIGSFSRDVDEELVETLKEFKAEGKKYLLLDMRDNGGGYVTSGVNVLNQLVEAGPVLKFIDNDGREIVYYSELKEATFEIVALVNGNSASATEFVAASIQENGGTIVGETTYGKGVAQYLYELDDGAIVKLTQEAFYSGQDVAIHEIGVTPDIIIDNPDYMTKEVSYHLGDIHDSVANLEALIGFLGYSVGVVDTEFDALSVDGLKAFQEEKGLTVNGVADNNTQDALNIALVESINNNDLQLKAGMKAILEKINSKY